MNILNKISEKKGQIAILIDPEKTNSETKLSPLISKSEGIGVDYFFVGGSTVSPKDFNDTIDFLKENTKIPLVIFPGSNHQISSKADALLYLSLVSGRNPDYLISHHVTSALEVFHLGIEIIPTGYILVDGLSKSSVAYVSQTTPIPRHQHSIALRTALAAQLQGKKIIYFDAGSGAEASVPMAFITELRKLSSIPIIVGGGVKSIQTIHQFYDIGVNVVVIGNKVEEDIDFLLDIHSYYRTK